MAGRDKTRVKRWLPTAGWVEWCPSRGRWVPMEQATAAELAHAGQWLLEALPGAEPLCARCGRPMERHVLMETFGCYEGVLICP